MVFQVNSVDDWNRHRVEGYGYLRIPETPGYHKVQVSTWRPRASLDTEISSFFLGGSVRIHKIEEIFRSSHGILDSASLSNIVNRFGLETIDSGRINVNLNVAQQDIETRKDNRAKLHQVKSIEKTETRKLVHEFQVELLQKKKAAINRKLLDGVNYDAGYDKYKGENVQEDSYRQPYQNEFNPALGGDGFGLAGYAEQ